MKKTFLFAALMAVATLVGCSSDDDNGTESGSTISVTPTTLSVGGSSSNNDVTVTASGAWTAASDASWISLTTTSGSGNASVTLMVDANSDSASRSGEVVFTSGSETAAVVVTQAAAGSSGSSFTIDIAVENIQYTTADISFTPSDQSQEYVYALFEAGELEYYFGDSQTDQMAGIIEYYVYYDAIEYFVLTGTQGGTFEGFTPSTSYSLYAFAINSSYTASSSDLFKADFTMAEAVATDEYNAWLGTWTMTSTSAEVAGKSLSLEVIFTDDDGLAVPGLTYSIYGWDVSNVRYILPLPATFDYDTYGFDVSGVNEMYTDEDGYLYEYVGYAEVPDYGANYIITGSYDALTATMDSGNQGGYVYGNSGTLSGGSIFNVWNVIMLAYDGYNYYSFYNDESLGFEDMEVLFGPFTLTKISDDETVPASYAPQRVPGFDNIEGQAPALKNVKAGVCALPNSKPMMITLN